MTLTLNNRTLSQPGVLPREAPNEPDIWWPGGDTCVLLNGDLENPVFKTLVNIPLPVIKVNGVAVYSLNAVVPNSIEYGQGCVMAPIGWSPLVTHRLPDWYLSGGVSEDALSTMDLSQYLGSWGPFPDPRITASGGSGRLFCSRVPGAIAASVEYNRQAGDVPLRDAAVRVAEQWQRACHLYTLSADTTAKPIWWDCDTWPDLLPYQGYSSSKGGPSTLYGAKRPPGVTWSSSGWSPDDPDHFAVDQSCLTAWLLDWPIAAANARCTMETGIATARREESTGGRGNGHLVRGLACFSLVDEARAFKLLSEQLTRNEARNVTGPGWIWPFVDRGNSTDNYHMPPSSVQWISDMLGYSADQNRNLARSASSFMVGINLLGYDLALRSPGFWESPLRTRLFAQMELDASHLLGPARSAAVDVDRREFRTPTDGGMWDDAAPPLYDLRTNRGDGGSKSVGPRFITPALAAYNSWKSSPELLAAISQMRALYGEWSTGSKWLEVWSMESL